MILIHSFSKHGCCFVVAVVFFCQFFLVFIIFHRRIVISEGPYINFSPFDANVPPEDLDGGFFVKF